MFADDKLEAVKNNLKAEFPEYKLADKYDSERFAQTFRLTKENNQRILLITIAREFLDDHDAAGISSILQSTRISDHFKPEGVSRVIVTNLGINVERA